MENYYDILKVPQTVGLKAIKQAFKNHLDRNARNPLAQSQMQNINEAYKHLSDKEKRKLYDMTLEDAKTKADADAKAIELDPTDAAAYYNRGIAYKALLKYDLAISDFSKAIKLDPTDAAAYYNRGIAYEAIGKTKEANADFKTANKLKK